jgi:hypothetical protein
LITAPLALTVRDPLDGTTKVPKRKAASDVTVSAGTAAGAGPAGKTRPRLSNGKER